MLLLNPKAPWFSTLALVSIILPTAFVNCGKTGLTTTQSDLMQNEQDEKSLRPDSNPEVSRNAIIFSAQDCIDCISFRLGPPVVVRDPSDDEGDSPLSTIRLSNGQYRSFTANAVAYAIDGSEFWKIAGTRKKVLAAGAPGTSSECGRWLNSVKRHGNLLLGIVHVEKNCAYSVGQTHKSAHMFSSSDEGLNWIDWGKIIDSGTPINGQFTGDGDCTMVDGHDGYFYTYCLNWPSNQTIVARAQSSSLGVGGWKKFSGNAWDAEGLGGTGAHLGFIGFSSFYLKNSSAVGLLGGNRWTGGLKFSLSQDRVHFTTFHEPLIHYTEEDWIRTNGTSQFALYSYATVINMETGGNEIGDHFALSYTYIPPGRGFSSRYKVMQVVSITRSHQKPPFGVGNSIVRWSDARTGRRRVTTAPIPGNGTSQIQEGVLGFVLTAKPETLESLKLEECKTETPAGDDFVLVPSGTCPAGTAVTPIGWILTKQIKDTIPLHRCYNAAKQNHFASISSNCEGIGRMEYLLGYIPNL